MARVFICYSRQSEAAVKALANDIDTLGHDVWFDQELSGGQAWWDQILANIRNSDVVLVALAPEAVRSIAVKREYGYATDLGKPILPVVVAEGISAGLLPPALSTVQFVDYQVQDRSSALRLARAISVIPPPKPLPQPLPQAPEVPLSYLGGLREKIDATCNLNFADQSALLLELKRSLRDPDTAKDGRALLKGLQARRDLFAAIGEEINELLSIDKVPPLPASSSAGHGQARSNNNSPQTEALPAIRGRKPMNATTRKVAFWRRLMGGVLGAVVGMVLGASMGRVPPEIILIMGTAGGVAGAIGGMRFRPVATTIVGFILSFAAAYAVGFGSLYAMVFAAPVGAILGAIAGVVMARKSASGITSAA
ncbi:MAG: toll/interleukin-1 receptor domain-containing protein [Betaproteobacteria bacterium]|jgi:hypothetical protein|nr:toll/interleukin-1 receptor domain-containing protein [Betaproteobacteria bacterium]